MNRRNFLGTISAATFLSSRLGFAADNHRIEKIGVQLYTVRNQIKQDFEGTIAKVAQIGYKEVEFAGYLTTRRRTFALFSSATALPAPRRMWSTKCSRP